MFGVFVVWRMAGPLQKVCSLGSEEEVDIKFVSLHVGKVVKNEC